MSLISLSCSPTTLLSHRRFCLACVLIVFAGRCVPRRVPFRVLFPYMVYSNGCSPPLFAASALIVLDKHLQCCSSIVLSHNALLHWADLWSELSSDMVHFISLVLRNLLVSRSCTRLHARVHMRQRPRVRFSVDTVRCSQYASHVCSWMWIRRWDFRPSAEHHELLCAMNSTQNVVEHVAISSDGRVIGLLAIILCDFGFFFKMFSSKVLETGTIPFVAWSSLECVNGSCRLYLLMFLFHV